MKKPIEVASIFLYNRPRLMLKLPVIELLNLIKKHKEYESRYPEIRKYTRVVINGSSVLFDRDISELLHFECELRENTYKMTLAGMSKLGKKLNAIYSDGKDFDYISSELMSMDIPPIRELEQKITRTREEAFMATFTSKNIGKEIGIEVMYEPVVVPYTQFKNFINF